MRTYKEVLQEYLLDATLSFLQKQMTRASCALATKAVLSIEKGYFEKGQLFIQTEFLNNPVDITNYLVDVSTKYGEHIRDHYPELLVFQDVTHKE